MKRFLVIDDNGQGPQAALALLREHGYAATLSTCTDISRNGPDNNRVGSTGKSSEAVPGTGADGCNGTMPLNVEDAGSELESLLSPDVDINREEIGHMIDFHAIRDLMNITGRKKVEDALRFTQFVIDRMEDQALWTTEDGRFFYVNDAACRTLGYSRVELEGMSYSDIDPTVTPQFIADTHRELHEKGFARVETVHRSKSGCIYPVEALINRLVVDGKEYDCIFATDITERKRAEATLRGSEERFRALVETSSDWIWEVDLRGVYTYASPKVKDILGYEPWEIIGKTPFDFMSAEEAERISRQFADIVESGKLFHGLENVNLHKSGHTVILETNGVPIFDAAGELCGFRGIDRDITGRKISEKNLKESEEKFRALTETSPTAIILIQGLSIIFANEAAVQMTGYTEQELLNMSFWEIMHDDFKEMVRNRGLARQRGETVPKRYESKIVTKDGMERWAVVSGSIMEYQGGPASIVTFLDVTEAKLAEEQISAALAEKVVLLKEVHHRVKNNLQIITSLLELQAYSIPDEKLRNYLRESQDRIRSMALVHEQLYKSKDFSQIDFGGYIRNLSHSLFGSYAADTGRISMKVDAGDIFLEIDRAIPCGLIINELISNSMKHAFPGGRTGEISVSIGAEEGWITLAVADTGVGMPPGLDPAHSDTMGLQLVTMLVRQLRGELRVEGEHGGAAFYITFPVSNRE